MELKIKLHWLIRHFYSGIPRGTDGVKQNKSVISISH